MSQSGGGSSDRRSRWTARRLRDWFLLDGSRATVAGIILLALLAVFGAIAQRGAPPFRDAQPLFYLFGAFVGGNLTLITVVVSINQLLLSREMEPPGELQSQISGVVEYRRRVEDRAGTVAPAQPLGFLSLVYRNVAEDVATLADRAGELPDREDRARLADITDQAQANIDHVLELLEQSGTGTFNVLSATLTTNYAEQITELRRLQEAHADALSPSTTEHFDRTVDGFRTIDIARQYFKNIYLQEELSVLSRVLFYVGIPAQALAGGVLLGFAAGAVPSPEVLRVLVPVVATAGFLPIVVLLAFILRTSTVIERTAATIPFTTPRQEH